MPGWHEATTDLRSARALDTLGIVVEQHPDRARLFMQWKGFDWPILRDPFNLLELPAVPITVILDPDGAIRFVQPRLDRIDEISRILAEGLDPVREPRALPSPVPGKKALAPPSTDDATAWSDHAVALALWTDRLDDAVAASARSVPAGADGAAWFRRGVVLRMRHDSTDRRDSDFRDSVEAWTRALEADPDNYIRRRRLQQYGPRLAKPYAFYDWVVDARADITSRGEDPVTLAAEPEGAEFSEPQSREERPSSDAQAPPRPDRRISIDEDRWVDVGVTVVPPRAQPGDAVRTHLDLRPGEGIHWNNETGPGGLWVAVPDGWSADPDHQEIQVPPEATSDERRHLEFELRIPATLAAGRHTVEVEALYAVCDDDTGVCMIRRRLVPVDVNVDDSVAGLGDRRDGATSTRSS